MGDVGSAILFGLILLVAVGLLPSLVIRWRWNQRERRLGQPVTPLGRLTKPDKVAGAVAVGGLLLIGVVLLAVRGLQFLQTHH